MDDSVSAYLWEVIFVVMFGMAVVVSYRLYNNSSTGNRGVETAIESNQGIREEPDKTNETMKMNGSDVYYAAVNTDTTAYIEINGTKYEITDGQVGGNDLKDVIDFDKEYTQDYITDNNGNVAGVVYIES